MTGVEIVFKVYFGPGPSMGVDTMELDLQVGCLSTCDSCGLHRMGRDTRRVFRKPRQFYQRECVQARSLVRRRVLLSFIFSRVNIASVIYVAGLILIITRYKLLFPDWRGYLVASFSLVCMANQHMSAHNRLRLDIKHEQLEIKAEEAQVGQKMSSAIAN